MIGVRGVNSVSNTFDIQGSYWIFKLNNMLLLIGHPAILASMKLSF